MNGAAINPRMTGRISEARDSAILSRASRLAIKSTLLHTRYYVAVLRGHPSGRGNRAIHLGSSA